MLAYKIRPLLRSFIVHGGDSYQGLPPLAIDEGSFGA